MGKLSDIARQLGSRGGKKRARNLSPEERKRIATLAGEVRWLSEKSHGRLLGNLRSLRAVEILRKIPKPKSVSRAAQPLPRAYGESGR